MYCTLKQLQTSSNSNHPVFHKNSLHNLSFPPHPVWFNSIASLFWRIVAWMAPCYVIMIFRHNAAKQAHSVQMTFYKPQKSCPSAKNLGSLKNSFVKLLRSMALSTFSTAPLTWKSDWGVCTMFVLHMGRESRPFPRVNTVTTLYSTV